jgi:hypothetical protein
MADNRTLKEYATPSTEEPTAIIVYPPVEGNNFEIKPALLNLVQQNQFSGSPAEDPNLHISTFLRLSGTIKANQEAVRLHLFPFSLRDRASAWFHSLERGSISSWDQMRQAFLARFFPPSKTARMRDQITRFNQRDGESLYEAWERYKEMLRVCPHHGLEQWLIIHTFYNGLLYNTKLTVDAAAGGAIMNKNYADAYALIEDMAQNHYQWTNERANTAGASSKKETGVHEVSSYDDLAAKVESLTLQLDKMNVNAVSPSPSCELCGIVGHSGNECQLGGVAFTQEQMNYAQYQGIRQGQNFYNRNSFGQQATPPSYGTNQRAPQKSKLELMIENFVLGQEKLNQEFKQQTELLKESLSTLSYRVDSIATHSKMLETQISQLNQQVSSSSQVSRALPGQPETNQKSHVNAVSLVEEKSLGGPILDIHVIESEAVSDARVESKNPMTLKFSRKMNPSPQGLAKHSKKAQLQRFIEIMREICAKIPFVEALSRIPLYANFLKNILSKGRKEDKETLASPKESGDIFLERSTPEYRYPGSFSIPCTIGKESIKNARCDLGVSVNLMPLSLFKKIGVGKLEPAEHTLVLFDHSTVDPAGYVSNLPVKIGGTIIPVDFMVVNAKEDPQFPILFGFPFLVVSGAFIDALNGRIVFHMNNERMEFELGNHLKEISPSSIKAEYEMRERYLASTTQNVVFDPI